MRDPENWNEAKRMGLVTKRGNLRTLDPPRAWRTPLERASDKIIRTLIGELGNLTRDDRHSALVQTIDYLTDRRKDFLAGANPTTQMLDLLNEKNKAYGERDICVALIARLALAAGYKAGLGRHSDDDTSWEDDWRNIVFVEIPTGQLSWHIHDLELPLFAFLPRYEGSWDGHTTPEKHARIRLHCQETGQLKPAA